MRELEIPGCSHVIVCVSAADGVPARELDLEGLTTSRIRKHRHRLLPKQI